MVAFAIGLVLPTLYLAVVPGIYLQLWNEFPSAFLAGGASAIVMLAAIVKTALYVYKHLAGDPQSERVERASKAFFTIHMGVAIPILLLILSALIGRVSPTEVSGIRVFFAFLASEFMIFPIIGGLYLHDVLRTRREGLMVPLLVSFLSYVVVMLVTVARIVDVDPIVLNAQEYTPWEEAGARAYFLLIFMVAFATNPAFWRSASLYSIDMAPPPVWIGGIYVVAISVFLYYYSRKEPLQGAPNYPPGSPQIRLPLDPFHVATSICIATLAALAMTWTAGFLLPDNVTAQALQVLAILFVVLVFTLRNITRESPKT
jgi:hypothetical protein